MTIRRRSLAQECLGFLMHLPVATIGGTMTAFLVQFLFAPLYWIFGNTPVVQRLGNMYDPLMWLPAFGLGFLINRRKKHFSAVIVGIVVGALFFALMWWDISSIQRVSYYANLVQKDYQGSYWRYEFVQLLSPEWTSCGASECLGKLLFTFPFFASVAYSVGAWFALKFPRLEERQGTVSSAL